MSPYQQRQLAQLTTSSEYAACRGKRGTRESQLCDCGARVRESSSHILLDCKKYEAERVAVTGAIAALADVVESECDYPLTSNEALEWAIEDWGPGWVQDSERVDASLRSVRQAVLDMHRVVKKRRYDSARAVPAERHIIGL